MDKPTVCPDGHPLTWQGSLGLCTRSFWHDAWLWLGGQYLVPIFIDRNLPGDTIRLVVGYGSDEQLETIVTNIGMQ